MRISFLTLLTACLCGSLAWAQGAGQNNDQTIAQQLRELEADGVISRHVYTEVPPRVEYELTEFGRSLETILELMQRWGSEFKARRLAEEPEEPATETP